MEMINTIIHGDCLEVMKNIETESIDAVITDPPYGIDFQSCWKKDKSDWMPKISNDKQPFIWWLFDAYRVVKPGGSLICFFRWDVEESFKNAITWAGFEIKSQVIWNREIHGMGDLKASFGPMHDVIWFATKGKFQFPNKRPKSVLSFPRVPADKLVHPNEKPFTLMANLVESVTKPGDLILEPFAGSGSTITAAITMDRHYIGIEKELKYVEIARKRIKELQSKGA